MIRPWLILDVKKGTHFPKGKKITEMDYWDRWEVSTYKSLKNSTILDKLGIWFLSLERSELAGSLEIFLSFEVPRSLRLISVLWLTWLFDSNDYVPHNVEHCLYSKALWKTPYVQQQTWLILLICRS